MVIILIIIAIVFLFFLYRRSKVLRVGSLALFTGGVKAGKSQTSVYVVIREYKRSLRSYYISCFFAKIFRKKLPEKPLIYSNVPLNVKWGYVPLTTGLIMRNERFRYKSVIYMNEATLVHDKEIYKDTLASVRISLFNKLIGHSTQGGLLVYDTQAIGDLPVVIRRCLNSYFYVDHTIKWIPFFVVAYVREDRYSEDGSAISVNNKDISETLKRVIIPKSVWKKYDRYCWSSFTDDKPIVENVVKTKDLKARKVISFDKNYIDVLELKKDEKKDN